MPKIQPISLEHHANRRWKRPQGYRFAAGDTFAPLAAQEFPKAMMAMPIAYIPVEGAYQAVALQGIQPGRNLFIAPDGRWIGSYLPAVYRAFPFALANAENNQRVLCINEDSGLVTDKEGESFFGEDGKLMPIVAELLTFLNQFATGRATSAYLCALLQQNDLIQPWPITLKGEKGEQKVEGLFRIDEAKLNALAADALITLRNAGALKVAYCQLLSMQHLTLLGQLSEVNAKAEAQAATKLPTKGKDLDLSFLSGGELFKF